MANTVLIKEMNKGRVRSELKNMRKATIYELSQKTGLSVVTVKAVLEELITQNEVYEGHTIPSNGGRPSMCYHYNAEFRYGIVIYGYQENNGNLIRLLVVNLFGECVRRIETSIENVQVSSFCRYIDAVLKEYPAIGAIGFGLPGVEENGIITLNDYSSLVGDAFMDYYRQRYNVPVVFINDVNAAVKGRFPHQSSMESQCMVGIYFPRIYPPGAGMVMGGQIYTGAHHFAGEIGHLLSGVDWTKIDYSDVPVVCKAVAQLLAVYCRIVAPSQFILYGDFFNEAYISSIKTYAQALLPPSFPVNATFSCDFGADVEQGMIISVLDLISHTLFSAKDLNS